LLSTDPFFQAQQLGGASIDKLKYTHANIIFKGTIQRKSPINCHEKNNTKKAEYEYENVKGQFLLVDHCEKVE
jgi:hypothetical protein